MCLFHCGHIIDVKSIKHGIDGEEIILKTNKLHCSNKVIYLVCCKCKEMSRFFENDNKYYDISEPLWDTWGGKLNFIEISKLKRTKKKLLSQICALHGKHD